MGEPCAYPGMPAIYDSQLNGSRAAFVASETLSDLFECRGKPCWAEAC